MRRSLVALVGVFGLVAAGAVGGLVGSSGGPLHAGPAALGIVPQTATRVLDTRSASTPGVNGVTVVHTKAQGAAAVAVNITITNTVAAGFVTAWDGVGAPPTASIINSSGPGETVANYAIVPVQANGDFSLFNNSPTDLIVDLMGYLPGNATPALTGWTATITGYGPSSTLTFVSGTLFNGATVSKTARVDVKCKDGSVKTDIVFDVGPGATKGFEALCSDGAYTSGASILQVLDD